MEADPRLEHTHEYTYSTLIRPTQSIICVPLQVNRSQKIILLIVQYNIQNPVPEILFSRI